MMNIDCFVLLYLALQQCPRFSATQEEFELARDSCPILLCMWSCLLLVFPLANIRWDTDLSVIVLEGTKQHQSYLQHRKNNTWKEIESAIISGGLGGGGGEIKIHVHVVELLDIRLLCSTIMCNIDYLIYVVPFAKLNFFFMVN